MVWQHTGTVSRVVVRVKSCKLSNTKINKKLSKGMIYLYNGDISDACTGFLQDCKILGKPRGIKRKQ